MPSIPPWVVLLRDLPRILKPLLVLRRLLPAFVGRARGRPGPRRRRVLAVLAGFVAGAVGAEAEVLGMSFSGASLNLERRSPP